MDKDCCGGSCGCDTTPYSGSSEPSMYELKSEKLPGECQGACACDSSDDGFGDDYGESGAKIMRSMDRTRLEEQLQKAGYVEGVTSGRESALQEGFDEGIKLGSRGGMAFGYLTGYIQVMKLMLNSELEWQKKVVSEIGRGGREGDLLLALDNLQLRIQEAEKSAKLEEVNSEAWKEEYVGLKRQWGELMKGSGGLEEIMAPGEVE